MEPTLKAYFKHVGIYVHDLPAMADFYTRWFGLVQTDGGMGSSGKGAFFSSDPAEHHQIVMVVGRDPASKPTINQLSFLVDDLEHTGLGVGASASAVEKSAWTLAGRYLRDRLMTAAYRQQEGGGGQQQGRVHAGSQVGEQGGCMHVARHRSGECPSRFGKEPRLVLQVL